MGLFNKILHAGEGRRLKAVQAIVPEINALEPEVEALTDEQLVARTTDFRQQVDRARSSGKNPEHGEELWRSAGREARTVLEKDVKSGRESV